jgi:UDP:flavonoid glycosyltransferase YjiC (YdhE family)
MKKILIIADGITMAHPTRMDQLASMIDGDKFEIHFATPEAYFPMLTVRSNSRVTLHSITSVSTKDFTKRLYQTKFPWTNEDLDRQLAEDLELIKKIKPDVIIGDSRLSLIGACRMEKIPYYNLVNFHWNPTFDPLPLVPSYFFIKLTGRALGTFVHNLVAKHVVSSRVNQINKWLTAVGCSPVKSIADFYCQGDYLFFPDLKENFLNKKHPQNGYFIGPLIWKNKKTTWPKDWGELNPAKKYALVSMGSSGNTSHVPKIVEGLNSLGFTVLYVGPKSIFKDLTKYDMLTADFIPLDVALNYCSLAIGNGGTGTTYYYLSRGIPFYNVPTNLDQYLNVEQLKHLGLSDYQHGDGFSQKTFIDNISRLITSSDIQKNLQIKKELMDQNLYVNSVNEILSQT